MEAVQPTDVSIRQFVAETLGVDPQLLDDEVGVGDLPEWDSLAQVALVAGLERRFGRPIDVDEAFELESVGDIIDLLGSP